MDNCPNCQRALSYNSWFEGREEVQGYVCVDCGFKHIQGDQMSYSDEMDTELEMGFAAFNKSVTEKIILNNSPAKYQPLTDDKGKPVMRFRAVFPTHSGYFKIPSNSQEGAFYDTNVFSPDCNCYPFKSYQKCFHIIQLTSELVRVYGSLDNARLKIQGTVEEPSDEAISFVNSNFPVDAMEFESVFGRDELNRLIRSHLAYEKMGRVYPL